MNRDWPLTVKQLLARCGIEFWLPLGLLGAGVGLMGQVWTNQYLQASNRAIAPLTLTPNTAVQDHGLLSARAVLNSDLPFTRVEVIVVKPVPRTLQFLLPLDTPSEIEAELGNRLKVSPDLIRRLMRYENASPAPDAP
ncbi:MAG: hypothetical protein EA342_18515 [Leptolyngbya sp. LCM1.Bin17]|nr:MAG: hypothetical protein EA342_18515 [Leptolyngbya sp. LCM1.Bin17]